MTRDPPSSSSPLLPERTNSQSSSLFGILLITLTTFLFCIPAVLARYVIHFHNFPLANFVFIRTFVHTILTLFSLFLFRPPLPPSRTAGLLVVARGALGAISLVLSYYAISIIPIGLASTVFSSNTIITFVISNLILHEPFTSLDFLFSFLALVGVSILSLSVTDRHDLLPILAIFTTAVFASISYVVVRGCRQTIHFIWFVLSFGACGVIVAASMMGFDKIPTVFTAESSVGWAIFAGVAGFAGNCALNKGLMLCNAGEAAVIMTLKVPLLYIFGGLFMGEWPSLVRAEGAIMVMVAVVGVAVKRIKKG